MQTYCGWLAAAMCRRLRPACLAAQHGVAGALHQAGAVVLRRERGHADAGGEASRRRSMLWISAASTCVRTLGHARGGGQVGVGHHEAELLAAVAPASRSGARCARDLGEAAQRLVAARVAVAGVDVVEVVEVDQRDGQRAAVLRAVSTSRARRASK
jgi:hypothetical protein